MNIVGIAGISLCAAVFAAMLRRYHQEYAVLLSVAVGAVILLELLKNLAPSVGQIRTLLSSAGLSSAYAAVLLKTLGICFLTQFSADSCRDAGESALAAKVELAGKLAIVALSLPLFEEIAGTAAKLTGSS